MATDDIRQIEEFRAERVHFYAQQLLADYPGIANSLELKVVESATIEGLVYMMKGWCLAGQIPGHESTETVRWPDGWWQAWKEQYAPRWIRAKFPVVYAERIVKQTTSIYFVCPHMRVPDYGDGRRTHLQFMATGTPQAGRL